MANLDELSALLAVIDRGSFTDAAAHLSQSRSSVSRAVSRLEDRLGVRLLHRTTRVVAPTAAGQAYCDTVRPLLDGLAAADAQLSRDRDEPQGDLRVALPMAFGVQWMGPILHDFQRQWPRVRLDVRYDDLKHDLVAEGIDLALRGGVKLTRNLVAQRLWPFDLLMVASPAYLARSGPLDQPHDLVQHDCLLYSGSGPSRSWPLQSDAGSLSVTVDGPMRSNSARALAAAAEAGLGITLLPEWSLCDALAAGRLQTVLEPWTGGTAWFWVVRPSRSLVPARVRAFIDHLSQAFDGLPWRGWRAEAASPPQAPGLG